VDIILGPEMKSTGEVMGIDYDLGMAFAKSQMAAGGTLPTKGNVFISVNRNRPPQRRPHRQRLRTNSASPSTPPAAPAASSAKPASP
jgi:hypothetical protein